MPATNIQVSILIVHHDGLEIVQDCLRSIFENPPAVNYEVILVDNCSTDGAVDMVETYYPQVRLIRNSSQCGFAVNQNQAIQAATGQFLFILNDDTVLHKGAVDKLIGFLNTHDDVAAVGPQLQNSDGSIQLSCFRFPSPLRCLVENLLLTAAFPKSTLFGDYRDSTPESISEVDFVTGAAILVRRRTIEEVGLFDPRFYMYFEEVDWQVRMRSKGWKVFFCSDAIVTHLGGQSTTTRASRQLYEFNLSYTKFMRKHYGWVGVITQRLMMILGAILRLSIWSCIFLLLPNKRKIAVSKIKQWQQLLAWWMGFGPYEGLS